MPVEDLGLNLTGVLSSSEAKPTKAIPANNPGAMIALISTRNTAFLTTISLLQSTNIPSIPHDRWVIGGDQFRRLQGWVLLHHDNYRVSHSSVRVSPEFGLKF